MAENDREEEKIEISLRPTTFKEYIGQQHLKNNIKLAIDAVKKRSDGSTLDHVLLYGPPGLGKTTMAGKLALNSRRFAADEEKGMERFKAMTSGGQAGNSEN